MRSPRLMMLVAAESASKFKNVDYELRIKVETDID
jgi:hypothetical protein